ncbi:hypothetical protein [Marinicauda salina]|uniref:hypothetical protein n=1 Tax=Marinicauda salina TaxID=2135793 RepID=UPI0011B25053|nr:hypothetical protein [Marinicauda salina]
MKVIFMMIAATIIIIPLGFQWAEALVLENNGSNVPIILHIIDDIFVVVMAISMACVLEAVELNWDCLRQKIRFPIITNLIAILCGFGLILCVAFLAVYASLSSELEAISLDLMRIMKPLIVLCGLIVFASIGVQAAMTVKKSQEARARFGYTQRSGAEQ